MICVANATKQDFEDLHMMELASKAAGLKVLPPYMPSDNIGILNITPSGDTWSPLHDDGDALRLAVKLRLEIYFFDGFGEVVAEHNTASFEPGREQYADDMNAATRRAIVRAAAEIGRSME